MKLSKALIEEKQQVKMNGYFCASRVGLTKEYLIQS